MTITQQLAHFTCLSLNELNQKAELLKRHNNKYILTSEQVSLLLAHLQPAYDALEINHLREFDYHTIYYDTPAFDCFADHKKARRKRFKIRQRHYVNSDTYVLEVKLKAARGFSEKFRINCATNNFGELVLSDENKAFCQLHIKQAYQKSLSNLYLNSLQMHYKRITLVAKQGHERITLDHQLVITDRQLSSRQLSPNQWIVEVKAEHAVTAIDRWLFRQHLRPVANCSKYSVAVSLLKYPKQNDMFKHLRPALVFS